MVTYFLDNGAYVDIEDAKLKIRGSLLEIDLPDNSSIYDMDSIVEKEFGARIIAHKIDESIFLWEDNLGLCNNLSLASVDFIKEFTSPYHVFGNISKEQLVRAVNRFENRHKSFNRLNLNEYVEMFIKMDSEERNAFSDVFPIGLFVCTDYFSVWRMVSSLETQLFGIKHHLNCIFKNYDDLTKYAHGKNDEYTVSGEPVVRTNLDFYALLSCARTSLDMLCHVISKAFYILHKVNTPSSIHKIYKDILNGKIKINSFIENTIVENYGLWIAEMKDYRDFVVHFGSFQDYLRGVETGLITFENGFLQVKVLIPDNPQVKDVHQLKYNNKLDILDYSLNLLRNTENFIEKIINEINCILFDKWKY